MSIEKLIEALEKIAHSKFKPWSSRATDPGDETWDGYVDRLKFIARNALETYRKELEEDKK